MLLSSICLEEFGYFWHFDASSLKLKIRPVITLFGCRDLEGITFFFSLHKKNADNVLSPAYVTCLL